MKPVLLLTVGFALTGSPALAADTRTPEAVALQSAVESACLPLLAGKATDSAAAAGFRRRDGQWRRTMASGESLVLRPPGGSNPHVCSLRLTYRSGGTPALVELLSAWTAARGLAPGKVKAESRGPARQRETWTWAGSAPAGDMAIVFAHERTLDGQPAAGGLEAAQVLLSLTPRSPAGA